LGFVAVEKIAPSTEESIMMNLALTDQFGISNVQVSRDSLQSAKQQRRYGISPLRAERLLWVSAAILALGVLKKYAAPSAEHLCQIPEGKVDAQHHPELLTRIREAGW
jgi:hypothetical protein